MGVPPMNPPASRVQPSTHSSLLSTHSSTNPTTMQYLRQRIRDILKAAPEFAPDEIEILVEDKAALEFIFR